MEQEMSKYTRWYGPKAKAQGLRPQKWIVSDLIEKLGERFTVFVSFGHVNGIEGFGRETGKVEDDHFVVRTNDGTGHVITRYRLDSSIRILVK
jgi:hypothetical protein